MAELAVALGLWQDRPSLEALDTARAADALGYARLWIGEMATYDAFALATAVPGRIPLVLGPFAVAVRTPVQIAIGAASVAELTGRTVEVAIGSSSPVVVGGWHGRAAPSPARALAETATALRTLLDGGRADLDGSVAHPRLPAAHPRARRPDHGGGVPYARTRPKPADLLAAVPAELVGCVGAIGDAGTVRKRLAEYADAGVDEICLVPTSTDTDPAGTRTLTTLAP